MKRLLPETAASWLPVAPVHDNVTQVGLSGDHLTKNELSLTIKLEFVARFML